MHQWETVRCVWVIGYTHFNQKLRERMRAYVIDNAEKERHIRRKEEKCLFPVIFKRQDLTCHNTSWNVWMCVFIPRFLRESVCFVGREVEERWTTVSVNWNWLLLRLCFQGQCDHHTHPRQWTKITTAYAHPAAVSLSRLILCSGHTFPIVLLTTRQTAANISSLSLSLSLCLTQTLTHYVVWHERERL